MAHRDLVGGMLAQIGADPPGRRATSRGVGRTRRAALSPCGLAGACTAPDGWNGGTSWSTRPQRASRGSGRPELATVCSRWPKSSGTMSSTFGPAC